MNAKELAKRHRELADELDAMNLRVQLEPGLDLSAAMTYLRQMLPDRYVTLAMTISSLPSSKTEVAWNVWDGKKHHEAATLDAAMQLCRVHNQPVIPAKPLEFAMDTIAPSIADNF